MISKDASILRRKLDYEMFGSFFFFNLGFKKIPLECIYALDSSEHFAVGSSLRKNAARDHGQTPL